MASKHAEDEPEERLVNRTGDFVLTTAYFVEVVLIFWKYWSTSTHDFMVLITMIGVTAIAVKLTELFCKYVMHDIVSKKILGTEDDHPLDTHAIYTKFVGTAWQFVIHFTMSCLETYVLLDEPWMSTTWTCFDPLIEDFIPKPSLRFLFTTQIAIWIYTCYSHRFNSDAHAHKDYFAMYIHHIATIGLVGLAYNTYERVGIIVLWVHDVSDIGIDVMKLTNYLQLEGLKNFFITEMTYVFCISLWGYFRWYLFPFEIIMKSSMFALVDNDKYLSSHGTTGMAYRMIERYGIDSSEFHTFLYSAGLCNILLVVLLILHIWWGALLLRIGYRMLTSDNPHEAGEAEYEGRSKKSKSTAVANKSKAE